VPARSFDIYLQNITDFILTLNSTDVPHGIFTVAPPLGIVPGSTGHWAVENDPNKYMTGCEATVTYNVTGQMGQVQVYAQDPYQAENLCSIEAINGAERVVSPEPSGRQEPNGNNFTFNAQLKPV